MTRAWLVAPILVVLIGVCIGVACAPSRNYVHPEIETEAGLLPFEVHQVWLKGPKLLCIVVRDREVTMEGNALGLGVHCISYLADPR